MSDAGAPCGLSEQTLLSAWEDGVSRPRPERALGLLRRAAPGAAEDAARWPLGRHDAALLDLYRRAFGTTLTGTAVCPECDEEVELSLALDELRADHAESLGEHDLDDERTRHRVRFRLLCTDDMVAAARQPDAGSAQRVLLERCVLSAERNGKPVTPGALPPPLVEELGRRLAAADPQAELRLHLRCPACQMDWPVDLDPAAFVWRELDEHARSTLFEVACLATAYGWSENEVLALSAKRRGAYLELAGA